jgi:hypothetical protein
VLFLGVFAPIVNLPFIGNQNYFQNGQGDGAFILLLALTSLALVFTKLYRGLWITALLSLAILIFTFVNLQTRISDVKEQIERDLANNPFRGIAQMALQSVQIEWGWAVLIVGVALLIASAAIKSSVNDSDAG